MKEKYLKVIQAKDFFERIECLIQPIVRFNQFIEL